MGVQRSGTTECQDTSSTDTASVALGLLTALAGPFVDLKTPGNHILSTEEIIDTLYSIEAASDGLVDVFTLTEFAAGPVTKSEAVENCMAKGTGPTVVWITANIHGNEKAVSHGAQHAEVSLAESRCAGQADQGSVDRLHGAQHEP